MRRHELLTPVDAAWFRMDAADDPADVAAILFFDGSVDEARLRRTIEQRLLSIPRFRRRVVDRGSIAPPEWKDDERFTLDAHLKRIELAPDDDLAEVVSQLVSVPMSFEHSPWSATVLHGLPAGDALFVRLHHCLGDGFALLDVLVSLADTNGVNEGDRPPPPAIHHDGHRRGAVVSLARILALRFDPATFLRGPLSGRRRVAWTPPLSLDDVKTVAHAHRATVNDFLLAALSAALRRYLIAREGTASRIRAVVPVNLRPNDVPIDLDKGNWFGLVFLDLPVQEDTRDRRLTALRRSMDKVKRSKDAGVTLWILGLMGRVPVLVDRMIEALFARKASLVVTNVPGPRTRLHLAGAPVRDMVFWVPHPCGFGLGISIMSYAGRIRVGFRADTSIVPDPELLARFFEEELNAELAPLARKERHHEQRVT